MAAGAPTRVDFWFDPTCPFAWMTSRWIHEVAEHRPLDVRWHLMSLVVLHEQDGGSTEGEFFDRYWRALRVLAAAEARGGSDALGRLYTAIGVRVHPRDREMDDAVLVEAIADAGLDADLAAAADDASWETAVRASHEESQDAAGTSIGTPIVRIGERAFFGPVVNPAPRGEDALRLFDAVAAMSSIPGFAELKRGRAAAIDFS